MGKLHDSLRDWLVLLGQSNGFEAWTPDLDNSVEFSKIKNIKVDYRPDVVWQVKRTKGKAFFELAFNEDWRQIIGEVLLGSQVDGYVKTFIIRPTDDESYWKNIEKFLRFAFRKEGIFKKYDAFRPKFILFKGSLERNGEEDKIKEIIIGALRKERWIK